MVSRQHNGRREVTMKTAQVERIPRELQPDPAEQFVESLLEVAERLWPRSGTPPGSVVACRPVTPVTQVTPVQA
jgi:hypothetical protein